MTADLEHDVRASLERLDVSLGPVCADRDDLDRRIERHRRRRRARQAGMAFAALALVGGIALANRSAPPEQVDVAAPDTAAPNPTTVPAGAAVYTPEEFLALFANVWVPDESLCPISFVLIANEATGPVDPRLLGSEVHCVAAWGEVRIAFLDDPEGDGPAATAAQWGVTSEVVLDDGTIAIGSGPYGPFGGGLVYNEDGVEIRLYGEPAVEQLVVLADTLRPVTAADYEVLGPIYRSDPPGAIDPGDRPAGYQPLVIAGMTFEEFVAAGLVPPATTG
jgi:hypothetical protein